MKKIAVMILGLFLMQAAQAAVMNWGAAGILADSTANGDYGGYTGYAAPGTDVYLIYNGIDNSDPVTAVYTDEFGTLQIVGGTLIASDTSTLGDWNIGNFIRQIDVPDTSWPADPVADWDAMNTKTFTMIANSEGGAGSFYGIYTANADSFSNALGVNSIGGFQRSSLDAGSTPLSVGPPDFHLAVESAYGTPSPKVGFKGYYGAEAQVTCSVENYVFEGLTRYPCIGWIGTGDVPASGSSNNTGPITLTQNSSITWLWGDPEVFARQAGMDIDGEAAGDESGRPVSMSSDGTRIAIGAYYNDGNGSNSGHVRIFEYSGGSWNQLGADIDGEAAGDKSGRTVSMSSDGTRIAIGALWNDGNGSNSGHVRIFEYSGGSWNQLGTDIDGEAAGDESGLSVSMSSDGNHIAIGAYYNDGNGSNSGHVRIFEYSGGSWNQLGADIDGEAANDESGWSISMSSDGTRIAIGARYNDGNGSNSGHVRIFEYSGGSWSQLGTDIDGEAAGDESGRSVSMSSDGTRIAIGARYNDGNGSNSGHVRIFEYSGGSWSQLGTDIDGEAANDESGLSVSMSSDGTRIAIGARWNDGNGSNSGHVRIFEYSGGSWSQLGTDIDGEAANDESGLSVSMSSDGNHIAIGARFNDGNGSNSGHVRVFDFAFSITIKTVGNGTVTPPAGTYDFDAETNLLLSATADAGWLFMGWSGNVTSDHTVTTTNLLIDGLKTVTATFSDDADEDGLTNNEEGTHGTDPRNSDSDADGLSDGAEINIHSTIPLDDDSDDDLILDGDEVANGLNPLSSNTGLDSDSDGLNDAQEVNVHGTDPLDDDSDDDLILDGAEVANGLNPLVSNAGLDSDSDGLNDAQEVNSTGTDPLDDDSDDDLILDGAEVANGLNPLVSNAGMDSDSDGLNDAQEVNSTGTDPLDNDSDDDGLIDGDEVNTYGTDPLDDDTDDDLIVDRDEIDNGLDPLVSNTGLDSDSDGLSDVAEVNTYGTNPLLTDTDGDFLLDLAELFTWGTNPTKADTDDDGLTDHTEIFITVTGPTDSDSDDDGLNDGDEVNTYLTDPKDADSDNDGLLDGDEINIYYTDPLNADTDSDGLTDGDEVNVYFTIPTDSDTDNDGASDGDEVNVHGTDPNDANSDADQDEDGIYDVWERQHFGVIENCNPGDDPDGDLYTNIEEFQNDTDPNTWDFYLEQYTSIELVWKMSPGTNYQIQCSTTLASNSWENVGGVFTGDGTTNAVFDSTRYADKNFYRVIVLP